MRGRSSSPSSSSAVLREACWHCGAVVGVLARSAETWPAGVELVVHLCARCVESPERRALWARWWRLVENDT